MKFTYKAERNSEVYTSSIEAEDRFEVYRQVRAAGATLISVTSDKKQKLSLSYWNERLSTVKEHDKILLATNLSAMLSAGLSISRALSVAERQTRSPKLRRVISEIRGDIHKGGTMYEALAKFPKIFSHLFVAMVRSGEESGALGESLSSIGSQLENAYQLKKRIKGALIYPSIILIAIFGIGFLLMTNVVPTLAKTFKDLGSKLPASTQAIINLSDFLVKYTGPVLIGTFVFFFALKRFLRTPTGHRIKDKILLTMPLINELVKEINTAHTARTMSSLLRAGVDIVTAINITSKVVQNTYHREVLIESAEKVQKGGALSEVFIKNEKLYPPMMGEMISVGEETGALSDMLLKVAVFYEGEVAQKTKNMSTIIEPFLMLIIGAAVGFFAVAMIGPIYALSNAF